MATGRIAGLESRATHADYMTSHVWSASLDDTAVYQAGMKPSEAAIGKITPSIWPVNKRIEGTAVQPASVDRARAIVEEHPCDWCKENGALSIGVDRAKVVID